MRRLFFYSVLAPCLLLFISCHASFAQSVGHLLVVSDSDCQLSVDGDDPIDLLKNTPHKLELSEGEHFLQATGAAGDKSEVVTIEPGKQKVLQLKLGQVKKGIESAQSAVAETSKKLPTIKVADLTLKVSGGLMTTSNQLSTGETAASSLPTLYYTFQENDQIIINTTLLNKQGSNKIEIMSYPDGNVIYSNLRFENLDDLRIDIPTTGIYRIALGTNHTFDRKIHIVVERIPESEDTINASTSVVKRQKFTAVNVQEPMQQWVNSTSHETWRGGSAEVVVPVNLPPNTVEWYYIVSASREKADIEANLQKVSLFGDVNTALMGLSPTTTALNIGLDIITQPPGAHYCDVYLLDYQGHSAFMQDQAFSYNLEGTRENVTSAKVKVNGVRDGQCYLGIKNRNGFHGIAVGVEVVAIVMEEYLESGE